MNRLTRKSLVLVAPLLLSLPVLANDDDEVRKMQRATAAAKISLNQAIEIAQREVSGGKAVEVELEWRRSGPRIEVEVLAGEMWKEVVVDAVNGKVLAVINEVPDDADDRTELQRDKENCAAATVTFAEALEAAEKDARGGKPVEIELTSSGGKPCYKVEMLVGDRLVKRRVPATNGQD